MKGKEALARRALSTNAGLALKSSSAHLETKGFIAMHGGRASWILFLLGTDAGRAPP